MRRLFATAPKDPRYHMLEHLAPKFKSKAPAANEPRAALILNRFSRELPVMFATHAVEDILGVKVDQAVGKSFYECIQETCHREAIRVLESAKANDSIAYLRFWYRNPRRDEDREEDDDDSGSTTESSSDSDGGVELNSVMDYDEDDEISIKVEDTEPRSNFFSKPEKHERMGRSELAAEDGPSNSTTRTSSGVTTDMEHDAAEAIFDGPITSRSSTSSVSPDREPPELGPYEIEAVVSCSSDGLVVVLRRVTSGDSTHVPQEQPLNSGIFAAPWAQQPILPDGVQARPLQPYRHGIDQRAPQVLAGGPTQPLFDSIRDNAVFAWSVCGINGNIAEHGRGTPRGQAQPSFGLPIWEPNEQPAPSWEGPINQAVSRWTRYDQSMLNQYDQPGPTSYQLQPQTSQQRSHAHNNGLGHQAQRYQQNVQSSFSAQLNDTGMQSLFEQRRQYHNASEIDFQYRNYETRGYHPRVRQRRSYRGNQNGYSQNSLFNGAPNYQRRFQTHQQNFSSPNGSNNRNGQRANCTHHNNNGFSPYSRDQTRHQSGRDASHVPISLPPLSQSGNHIPWNDRTGIVQPLQNGRGGEPAWGLSMNQPAPTVPTSDSAAPDGSGNLSQHFREASK